jgi:hypothetical protein
MAAALLACLPLGTTRVISQKNPHQLVPWDPKNDTIGPWNPANNNSAYIFKNGSSLSVNDTSWYGIKAFPFGDDAELAPQESFSSFRPICQTSLDGKCQRGPKPIPGEFYCSDMRDVKHNGGFKAFLDLGLTYELARQLKGMSVIELGAGDGCYTGALHDLGLKRVEGFEGQTDIEERTEGLVKFADPTTFGITTEVGGSKVGCADYVLSLELPQNVPTVVEADFLDNLRRHSSRGLVLSWPNTARVHVTDEQGKEYDIDRQPVGINFMEEQDVIKKVEALGYFHDANATAQLRDASKNIPWLATSVFHFRKINPTWNVCPGISEPPS